MCRAYPTRTLWSLKIFSASLPSKGLIHGESMLWIHHGCPDPQSSQQPLCYLNGPDRRKCSVKYQATDSQLWNYRGQMSLTFTSDLLIPISIYLDALISSFHYPSSIFESLGWNLYCITIIFRPTDGQNDYCVWVQLPALFRASVK